MMTDPAVRSTSPSPDAHDERGWTPGATSARHDRQEKPGEDAPVRYLTGTDGRRWTVKERVDACGDAAHPRRTLVADAGTVVRRLCSYPTEWTTCDATALLKLLEGPVTKSG